MLFFRLAFLLLRRRLCLADFLFDLISREDAALLILGDGARARLVTVRYSVVVDVDLKESR